VAARFYCPDGARDGRWRLGAEEARHLSRVCRLGVGDTVEIFDGEGHATKALVVKVESHGVELTPLSPPLPERLGPFPLTLASAVPKGDRFDWLVEKATELGVERLIPIVTERSVVEPGDSKLARLRKSIIEASKQCRRDRLMILDPPMRWDQFVGLYPQSLRFLADPQGIAPSRWPTIPPGEPVILAVGPEGGFTPSEQQAGNLAGWLTVSLGTHILRIETAGLAGCAALLTRVEEAVP
jgi:16S rRNA (uracil1498-N3)-methyltransferase